jgi:hypothetical protein
MDAHMHYALGLNPQCWASSGICHPNSCPDGPKHLELGLKSVHPFGISFALSFFFVTFFFMY